MKPKDEKEFYEAMDRLVQAAIACVSSPAWAGVCDEDVELEDAAAYFRTDAPSSSASASCNASCPSSE
jgi:hypothetical protein